MHAHWYRPHPPTIATQAFFLDRGNRSWPTSEDESLEFHQAKSFYRGAMEKPGINSQGQLQNLMRQAFFQHVHILRAHSHHSPSLDKRLQGWPAQSVLVRGEHFCTKKRFPRDKGYPRILFSSSAKRQNISMFFGSILFDPFIFLGAYPLVTWLRRMAPNKARCFCDGKVRRWTKSVYNGLWIWSSNSNPCCSLVKGDG